MPDAMGFETYAEKFVAALNAKFPASEHLGESFGLTEGARFDRITKVRNGENRSVHAFVERSTGKLIKAAGWKAPAKLSNGELNSKYDLAEETDFAQAVSAADLYGAYLYQR